MLSRRDFLAASASAYAALHLDPLETGILSPAMAEGSVRCINIVNFVRGDIGVIRLALDQGSA